MDPRHVFLLPSRRARWGLALTLFLAGCSSDHSGTNGPSGSGDAPGTSTPLPPLQPPPQPPPTTDPVDSPPAPDMPTIEAMPLAATGVDPTAMDPTADPCTDLYTYACGGWNQTAQIPAGYYATWRASDIIYTNMSEQVIEILDSSAAAVEVGTADMKQQQLGAYFGSCLDEAAIETINLEPLLPLLTQIRDIAVPMDVGAAVAIMGKSGFTPLFRYYADPGLSDPGTILFFLYENASVLGLRSKEAYLDATPEGIALLAEYQAHVQRTLVLAGWAEEEAVAGAAALLALETELAIAVKSNEELNPAVIDIEVSRAELATIVPQIDWDEYFSILGQPAIASVGLSGPEFFTRINELLVPEMLPGWRALLEYSVLRILNPALPAAFRSETDQFLGVLFGVQPLPRRDHCINETTGTFRDYIAQSFVENHFGAASRDAVGEMFTLIRQQMRQVLETTTWMDETTRLRALSKLDAMGVQVGYPDEWQTYNTVQVPGNYLGNRLSAQQGAFAVLMGRVGKPNISAPPLDAMDVNARYSFFYNQVSLPAAYLQRPMYDVGYTDAANFGAIGEVIGHEVTHGFDTVGASFNETGALENWWADETLAAFEQRAQCIVDQYSTYEWLPGVPQDGGLVKNEAIADNGGIKLAYRAYKAKRAGAEPLVIEGDLSEDQIFFIAFAQTQCWQATDEGKENLSFDSYHPSNDIRAAAAVTNMPEFGQAFGCTQGSTPLYPAADSICTVW